MNPGLPQQAYVEYRQKTPMLLPRPGKQDHR
jgi:hypothetical protein